MRDSIRNLALIVLQTTEDQFASVAMKETADFAEQWKNNIPEPEKPNVILSPKAQAIKEVIEKGGFDCRTQIVAQLVSELIGEKIELDNINKKERPQLEYTSFAVVFPINEDCKPYELNKPIMIIDGSRAIFVNDEDGELYDGPSLPRRFNSIRPANNEEIKTFVTKLYKSIITAKELAPDTILNRMINYSDLKGKPCDEKLCAKECCESAPSLNKI